MEAENDSNTQNTQYTRISLPRLRLAFLAQSLFRRAFTLFAAGYATLFARKDLKRVDARSEYGDKQTLTTGQHSTTSLTHTQHTQV